ncbi:MAG TPA: transcription antitermination factor NusB [Candidatus Paceibacterota bacterium]|nr:transcription antitermination factor NusB [Candidatus Paceibacterota bacterium]
MATRHLARSIVLQTLFEWDFRALKQSDIEPIIARNEKEFAPGLEEESSKFIRDLIGLVIKNKEVIDQIITKAAPEWPLEKISAVDRNVLRLGLAELLFGDRTQVPPKVAINEAIELAKNFGGENSGKFINGVLGAVYREIGEPGKEQMSKKKEPVDFSKLPVEKLGGAVIFARNGKEIKLALVHDIFGYWTLSKGGIEETSDCPTEEACTAREIKKELGLEIMIREKLGENEYVANHPEKGKIRKRVMYFLAETPLAELKLASSGGLDNARWFTFDEIADLKIYDDILPIIMKGIKIITG